MLFIVVTDWYKLKWRSSEMALLLEAADVYP